MSEYRLEAKSGQPPGDSRAGGLDWAKVAAQLDSEQRRQSVVSLAGHDGQSHRQEEQQDSHSADRGQKDVNTADPRQKHANSADGGQKDANIANPEQTAANHEQTAANTSDHKFFYNSGADLDPYLRGLTGRITYLGLRGILLSNESSWKNALAKAGPVGEQLIERMGALEAKGWSFGNLGFRDPFWELNKTGWLGRSARMFSLGGYHWDMHEGSPVKRIAINSKVITLANMIAGAYGTADAPKGVATLMAHEVGHEDGILRDHPGDWRLLNAEEQKTLARRMLATETRAILTQLHVAEQMGDQTLTNTRLRAALQGGNLGGFIHEIWGKSGDKYGSFSKISRLEARDFVNQYIAETFGKDVYNPRTGRVRAFDINAGLEKQIGSITGDSELAQSMKELRAGLRPAETSFGRFLSESKSGLALVRGGQALGAVGLLFAANDINGAFHRSAGTGVGRLGRVGVDWAGFEAGTTTGAWLGRTLAVTFAERRMPMVAIPFMIIGGGMVGAHLADSKLGAKVERFLTSAVDRSAGAVRRVFA